MTAAQITSAKIAVPIGRSVNEWRGKTPDDVPPRHVRLRIFDRASGKCWRCSRKINAGERWQCDHVTALINGGANAESNLAPLCSWCEPAKNAADVAEKSRVYTKRAKHVLPREARSRPLPGSRASGWRKRMNGTTERRT